MFLSLSRQKQWLDIRNVTTEVPFLKTCACGCSSLQTPASAYSLKSFPKFLPVILQACYLYIFSCHTFTSSQLSINVLSYSTLWTTILGRITIWKVPCQWSLLRLWLHVLNKTTRYRKSNWKQNSLFWDLFIFLYSIFY